MANKSNIFLRESNVKLVGTGDSPVVDIEGGDNWDLVAGDGDLRIGTPKNRLQMGVKLGTEHEGSARVWGTTDLRLGTSESDIITLNGTDSSPVVDITGGDHWNLDQNDGDVRIGDDENMLKMGVALGGGGAGNARIWATSKLRLGSNGTTVLNIDDESVNPHGAQYDLGTVGNQWGNVYAAGQLSVGGEIYGDGNLTLTGDGGAFTGRAIVQELSVQKGAFTILPLNDNQNLGDSDRRWSTVYADTVDAGTVDANKVVADSVNETSDRRLKTDIKPLKGGLDAILDLRPVSFRWRDNDDETQLGLIGQEVADVLPEAVSPPEDDEGYFELKYSKIVATLIDAVQTQQTEKEELEEQVDRQEAQLEEQREHIDDLEVRLAALEDAG